MLYNTFATNIGAGLNVFRWTVSDATNSVFDDVNVTNNSFTVDAGQNQIVCVDSAFVAATVPVNSYGIWTSPQSVVFVNPTSQTTSVKSLQVAVKQLIWTISKDNCTASDSVIISNKQITNAVSAGNPDAICSFNYTLSATPIPSGLTGRWTAPVNVTVTTPNQPVSTARNLNHGNNLFI